MITFGISVVVVITITSMTYVVAKWRGLLPYNQQPLKIETFDGLNSPFHPSIIYIKNGWNGWKYLMAETPFSPICKPYVDRNECPSIHVSNDGINWETPDGLVNPLVNFGNDGERNLDYYSDPHLVMANGRLECWYRLTERHGDKNHRNEVSLRRIYSNDLVNWSDEEVISQLWRNSEETGLGKMVVSPALSWDSATGYEMWFVDSEDQVKQRDISVSTSSNGHRWSDRQKCVLRGKDVNPWHIDVQRLRDGSLYMIVYDLYDLTIWHSSNGLEWDFVAKLLEPSKKMGSFYRNGLYRSCLVHVEDCYKLYFSAYDYYHTYIGLATFNEPGESPTIYSNGKNHNFMGFIGYVLIEEFRHISFIITHIFRRIIVDG